MTDFFHDHVGLDTHHHVPVPQILERYDFNGDGHVDAIAVDTDRDGRADTWEFDNNFDGSMDEVRYDHNGDGRVDEVDSDLNHDGRGGPGHRGHQPRRRRRLPGGQPRHRAHHPQRRQLTRGPRSERPAACSPSTRSP